MSRLFLISVFSMTLLAAFVLAASLEQGAQASNPTGLEILRAITAPVSNN